MGTIQDFLHPIDESFILSTPESIGSRVKLYFEEKALEGNIVLLGCPDLRGVNHSKEYSNIRIIREEFYQLIWNSWELDIYDLGDIIPGNEYEDTLFALQKVLEELINLKAYPIILGGSMSLNYSIYKALITLEKPLNFTCIDSKIEIEVGEKITDKSFLSKLILEEPNLLFNFANIGYQTYFVPISTLNMLNGLDFESIRLGNAVENVRDCEPLFRSADFVAVNLDAMESQDGDLSVFSSVNGFSNREICSLARYVGLSKQVKILGIFNFLGYSHNKMQSKLVSQLLWYVIDGKNQQHYYSEEEYIKYTVLHEDKELMFLRDKHIERWWLAINFESEELPVYLVPCTHKDYKEALQGNVPDKYWKTFKKFL